MRYLGEQDLTQVMGIGYLGEVRQGPDGNLYQWTQGVDGLGNPVGFWRKALKRLGRRVIRRALPLFRQVAALIPGAGPAVAALRVAAPLLRRAAAKSSARTGCPVRASGFGGDRCDTSARSIA